MKIIFISGADQKYGTYHITKSLLAKVQEIDKSIEFVVITQKKGQLNDWCDKAGIANYAVPYRYCVYYPTQNRIVSFAKLIYKKLSVRFLNWVAVKQVDRIGVIRDADLIHTNINRDLFGMKLAEKYRKPNITHLREFSRAHFQLEPLFCRQVQYMNQNTIEYIAISKAVKEDWAEYGLIKDKIRVIYDGIDVDSFCNLERKETRTGLSLVICGAIYEGKGQLELVNAVIELIRENLKITLDIIGSSANDTYCNMIMDAISKNKVEEYIHLKGYVENIPSLLSRYDVGVICSKAEGFGLVTIEYLLSGMSVIASNSGANPELLHNGEYGLLYSLGDIKDLKQKILELYQRKASGELTKINRSRIEKEYSIQNTAEKVIDLYKELQRQQ